MKRIYNSFAVLMLITMISCNDNKSPGLLTSEEFNIKLDSIMAITYPKVKKEIDNDIYGRWNIIKTTKIDSILTPTPVNSKVNIPEDIHNIDSQNNNEENENSSN